MTFHNAERHRFFVIPFYAEPDRLDKKLFLRPVLFEDAMIELLTRKLDGMQLPEDADEQVEEAMEEC